MALLSIILSWIPSLLLLLLGVLLLSFLYYCAYIKSIHMKYAHIPGPPIGHFLFGKIFDLTRLAKAGKFYETLTKWSQIYGPMFKVHVLHQVLIFTTCPETTKKILMSSKHLKDKLTYDGLIGLFGQRFLGRGILTELDNQNWYHQRRIMDPAFSSIALNSFIGPINQYSEKLMSKIKEAADTNSVINMTNCVDTYTLHVLAKVAFDMDEETMENNHLFTDAIHKCLHAVITQSRDAIFQFKPANKPYVESTRKACRFLRQTGREVISQRSAAIKNNERVPKDILSRIIKNDLQDETTAKVEEELMVDNFVTFLVGGQETTANQIAFCIRELVRHPDVLEKLKKEVDDVIGMRQDITSEDLGKLVYLGQVLKEILRLYPIGPMVSRRVDEDLVINGLRVPGSVHVMLSTYISSRSPEFFKDPLVFDPDRFHPDAPKPYYCYYPFSMGPRNCIGQNLSQMEAKVVVAKLVQRFDFSLTPQVKFGILDTGTLKPETDITCFVKDRDMKK